MPTIPLLVRRVREVLCVVDDALLEADATGQASVMPPVAAPAARCVQMHNVHFSVIHGWTSVVPFLEVECSLPITLSSPQVPTKDAESSMTAPMEIKLVPPPSIPPIVARVWHRRSPSAPKPDVTKTIAARRRQPPCIIDAPRGGLIFIGHHPNRVADHARPSFDKGALWSSDLACGGWRHKAACGEGMASGAAPWPKAALAGATHPSHTMATTLVPWPMAAATWRLREIG